MKIHLVRHGETLANAEKRYLGRAGSPFTDEGKTQNASALSKLAQTGFDAVYSSPSERCLVQARELAGKMDVNAIPDSRLYEIDFGAFEGLTWREAEKKYPEEFTSLCKNPEDFIFPGGESQKGLDARAREFAEEIIDSPHENIAVFSHGGTIMSVISHLLGLAPGQKWLFKITHGSITLLEVKDGYACIVL